MMRGYFSVIGLFFFLAMSILVISLLPAIVSIVNIALPSADLFTQIAIIMIAPVLVIGMLIGFYNSLVAKERGYGGYR